MHLKSKLGVKIFFLLKGWFKALLQFLFYENYMPYFPMHHVLVCQTSGVLGSHIVHFIFKGYPIMEFYLNKTGRPFLYSCSWPAYIVGSGKIVGTIIGIL